MRRKIVGVIFSRADLLRAVRMRKPPDLFELRLDRLVHCLGEVRAAIPRLPAPIIVTARNPREGGANQLPANRRRRLLLEYLPVARYVDVELRSARALEPVLRAASDCHVETIISFHDFKTTPPGPRLELAARGCVLNYAYFGSPAAAGQLSVAELRRFAERSDAVS
jgi:3-dehydroquinate dehydratase type I